MSFCTTKYCHSRSEEAWSGVDNCHRRLWYDGLPADYPVDQLLTTPQLRPLLLGANDEKLSAWVGEDWTESKHNILIQNLPKASKFLSPSQVQILSAPILNGDVSLYKQSVFNMLDVAQLEGLDWADVRDNVTMAFKCHLLAVRIAVILHCTVLFVIQVKAGFKFALVLTNATKSFL